MFRKLTGGQTRPTGGLVTIGTVLGLLVAVGATLFGVGAATDAIANYDASSWLWSSPKGEVARVNGVTGRVDTRYKVGDSQGHSVQVTQSDRYVIMRDLATGKVSVLDLSTLQVAATTQTTAGIGVSVALHGNVAFVVDSVQGMVSQLDPSTLRPMGQPLRFPPGLSGGVFDDAGRLWLLVPGEGTVVAVRPVTAPSARPGGGTGGSAPVGDPTVAQSHTVAEPSHDLALTVLDAGVAVLDKTATTLVTLRGKERREIKLALSGPGELPARTSGGDVPVTVVDDRHVYVVSGERVAEFRVPGDSPRLKPCVAWAGRFYCADEASGAVYVLDAAGKLANTIAVPGAGGALELDVREGHLFLNAPNSATARVVDDRHRVKVVDKYARDVLGADPPPNPPPPPPQQPTVTAPGAPPSVTATAGNALARVTWTPAPPNGAPVLKYVVEGGPRPVEVGAGQRGVEIGGLTNGQQYVFRVHAVNARGAGPKRASNPVVPTAEVPDPPASVTAQDRPDGTVTVSWPAANGQGRKVIRYEVLPVSQGTQAPARQTDATSLTFTAGSLAYGTQYGFTVVAVNDRGASSKPSPVSNTVVPYAKPGKPKNLQVTTVTDEKGALQVSWQAAEANGRPLTKYVVTAGGTSRDVPTGLGTKLTGLGNGRSVEVRVHAVNVAGAGEEVARTQKTIDEPKLTLGESSAAYNSVTVNVTVDNGGSPTTCTLAVAGAAPVSGPCTRLTVGGLWPGNSYNATVTATNAAGSTSAGRSIGTPALQGTVICPQNQNGYCNTGIWAYRIPRQEEPRAVSPSLRVGTRITAQCKVSDDDVNAKPYGGKQSRWWVRIEHRGTAYFPWAWAQLDGGDDLAKLPNC